MCCRKVSLRKAMTQTSVRAVRVSNRPLAQSNRDDIRALENELKPIQQRREELQKQLEVGQVNMKSLEQLINFSAEHAKSDLNRGVLDAKSLTELSSFSMAKREELSAEQFALNGQIKGLAEEIRILQEKRDELSSGSQNLAYQATIFVETKEGGAGVVPELYGHRMWLESAVRHPRSRWQTDGRNQLWRWCSSSAAKIGMMLIWYFQLLRLQSAHHGPC